MINFIAEKTKFNIKNKRLLKIWISNTIAKKNRKIAEVTIVFCDDNYLLSLNKQYLNHDTYTDIITFDYYKGDKEKPVCGDVFISIERVKENASKYSKTFENELHRVIIHGILHLLGYTDKSIASKKEMTKQENACLRILEKNFKPL